jgi:hypothetical protein
VQTAELIADLEKGLAAAKELAGQGQRPPEELAASEPAAAAIDTSQMPGGVDSAPVSAAEEELPHPITNAPTELEKIEHSAKGGVMDLVDIIGELKGDPEKGIPPTGLSEVAGKLLDQDGIKSILDAILKVATKAGL